MWWTFGNKRKQAYRKYILEHKRGVTKAGLQLGVPRWRLFIHDLDKLYPRMFKAYAEQFYDLDGNPQRVEESFEFKYTWNVHQKTKKHHWQHWVREDDDGTQEVMNAWQEDRYAVLEMLADWQSFEINGKGKTIEWYERTKNQKKLHPMVRTQVEKLLGI